jgi:diaminopimelate epimerase
MQYSSHMEIQFQKMHGTLNDFVVFQDLSGQVSLSQSQVATICNRREGVGSDGLIIVRSSSSADFFMDYMNADGSMAEMCGNGIRCLGKYVYDNGLTQKLFLTVDTRGGIKTLDLFPGPDGKIDRVRVDMGEPIFDARKIPVDLDTDGNPLLDYPLHLEGRTFRAAILSMGNPHCVIMDDGDIAELAVRFGPAIEKHPLFPAKTNVEFVKVLDRTCIEMRVWERGSGRTAACGTGACASAVVARLQGLVDTNCTVRLEGGDLQICWEGLRFPVLMIGPSVTTFKGEITI